MNTVESGHAVRTVPVYEVLAADIKSLGVEAVFGLMSDDTALFVTALDMAGITFHGARHENAAISMADLANQLWAQMRSMRRSISTGSWGSQPMTAGARMCSTTASAPQIVSPLQRMLTVASPAPSMSASVSTRTTR